MKKLSILLAVIFLLSACSNGDPTQTESVKIQATTVLAKATQPPSTPTQPDPTATATLVPTPSATPIYPDDGYGPDYYPSNVNPLTGLFVDNEHFLDKRPVAVKINIVPRTATRPPW